ncbi:small G protein signaling modulator 1-like isoform X2 [Punica granatum]|uniref:Small G protein signaling modulator 1-like isoform X2 n=1 Tax=Punica granatum TaxID=22663 RepID=A0A6P8DBW4_PUNGR|nr:small G protein signaling modulator 1-like isoform X2 [Punica granatum]
MLTQQKQPLMRALRRSHTSSSPSPSPSPSSNSSSPSSSSASSSSTTSSWIHLRSVFLVVAPSSTSPVPSNRGSLKSPWSRRRRKHALLPKQWKSSFLPDGRLCDGGVKLLKKVRSGGVDPTIRAEVWPFLLGVYDVNSSTEERESIRSQNRKEYDNLRKRCRQIIRRTEKSNGSKENAETSEYSGDLSQVLDSGLDDSLSLQRSPLSEKEGPDREALEREGSEREGSEREVLERECSVPKHSEGSGGGQVVQSTMLLSEGDAEKSEGDAEKSEITCVTASPGDSESTDSDSSESDEHEIVQPFLSSSELEGSDIVETEEETLSTSEPKNKTKSHTDEDFTTWQRIIRLDAVRANADWIVYTSSQANITELKARRFAESVGLKDYDHLEPCRIFHAARLLSILEAYAVYDPEIGYCQGMSDLLSPIVSVVEDDSEAFWCFVGFMKKARHNFRLDEVGIRRQLNIVSKIIRCKDSHLYSHLEKLKAEDCFFVYRMVVVLFRRELTFDQTLCLWEVIWADQAAIRAGIARSAWGRMRLRAPPNDDLLLYAIAASVLQRRKLIIEKYSSMEEIMRECNSMAGHLDVWKLLDDAHDLVANLHEKI